MRTLSSTVSSSPRRVNDRLSRKRRRRPRRSLRIGVERLECRLVLSSGLSLLSPPDLPIATDDNYVTDEDTVLTGNFISDDTGNGADVNPTPGAPLIVTAVNGQPLTPDRAIQLPSGATLSVSPEALSNTIRRLPLR